MGFGNIAGKCVTDPNKPRAQGVCDDCGEWFQLSTLRKQMQYMGTSPRWTGYLVCSRCLDVPQPQLKPQRLPPDPVPVPNPRTEVFSTIDYPQGFTEYTMWAQGQPLPYGVELMDGNGEPILDNYGQPIFLYIGSDGPALLSQLYAMTDIPVPGTIQNFNGTITQASVSQTMVAAAARSYIAIFNPCNVPMFFGVGADASTACPPSILLGPGGCLFWATAQLTTTPTPLVLTVMSPIAGVPFYCYTAP